MYEYNNTDNVRYARYSIIGDVYSDPETFVEQINGDIDREIYEKYLKDASQHIINNKIFKNDLKDLVEGGNKFIKYAGKPIEVTPAYVGKTINNYIWSIGVLSGKLRENQLPINFVDVDSILKKYTDIKKGTSLAGNKNQKYKLNFAFEVIVAINNATYKNEAILKANGITDYKSRDIYLKEISPKQK